MVSGHKKKEKEKMKCKTAFLSGLAMLAALVSKAQIVASDLVNHADDVVGDAMVGAPAAIYGSDMFKGYAGWVLAAFIVGAIIALIKRRKVA